jgi:hypothetical protein
VKVKSVRDPPALTVPRTRSEMRSKSGLAAMNARSAGDVLYGLELDLFQNDLETTDDERVGAEREDGAVARGGQGERASGRRGTTGELEAQPSRVAFGAGGGEGDDGEGGCGQQRTGIHESLRL